ncbi:MAG: PQQ-dependent sugar dehydrogenase [Pirellulales bacterium]
MSRRLRFAFAALLAVVAGTAVVFFRGSGKLPTQHDAGDFEPVSLIVSDRPAKAGATNLPIRAGQFVPFACEVAFDGSTFFDPLYLTPLPDGSGRLLVVERRGTVQLISEHEGRFAKQPLLDIADRVHLTPDAAEEGLLGMTFHPQFAQADSPHAGEFFVYYVAKGKTPDESTNRLSRLRMKPGKLDEVDHESEFVLIDQLQFDQAHNGGGLAFGPDGFLYLGLGDDGLGVPNCNAQKISRNLFSGILRIDVDRQGGSVSHPPPRAPKEGRTDGYFIPNDNPFVGTPDALEEFYAIGLRNPWRFSFDRKTGVFYSSDVGERRREEINVIERGSNGGWQYAEGTLLTREVSSLDVKRPDPYLGVETWPLFEYSRDAAHRCVIGGHVYRGKQFPDLVGRYVYADQSGRIYALDLADGGRRAVANHLIAVLPETGIGVSSLGEDRDGELYFCSIGQLASETGRVFRLRRTRSDERDFLPENLADTGLFSDWRNLAANPGLVAYDVALPLWSDGAEKRRWIIVPPGERVDAELHGKLRFPPGTVFVKHFDLPTNLRPNQKPRPLETRVLVCDDRGEVYGATYRWSSDGRRARLVTFNETETIAITLADGTSTTQTWTYPGRFECAICHNHASGQVLGFILRQLDRDVVVEHGGDENQIARLIRVGVLAETAAKVPAALVGRLARLDDESATLEHRVRSYLDVNCAPCHNPRTRFAAFDARLDRDIGEQGLVNGTSHYHKEKGPNVRIVRPGDLEMSMLFHRMSANDPSLRMPPLGTAVVDRKAVALLAAWIQSLSPQKLPAKTSPQSTATGDRPPQR